MCGSLSSTPNTRMNERKDWRKKEGRKVVKLEGEREKNWKRGREKERKKIASTIYYYVQHF